MAAKTEASLHTMCLQFALTEAHDAILAPWQLKTRHGHACPPDPACRLAPSASLCCDLARHQKARLRQYVRRHHRGPGCLGLNHCLVHGCLYPGSSGRLLLLQNRAGPGSAFEEGLPQVLGTVKRPLHADRLCRDAAALEARLYQCLRRDCRVAVLEEGRPNRQPHLGAAMLFDGSVGDLKGRALRQRRPDREGQSPSRPEGRSGSGKEGLRPREVEHAECARAPGEPPMVLRRERLLNVRLQPLH
mmetsp:Transcript_115331/g.337171  ORF Transcript_115331/g.337171 Transcript_115331/m.337171 type:complete len:246 (+) Transcript_115331:147-884(+)